MTELEIAIHKRKIIQDELNQFASFIKDYNDSVDIEELGVRAERAETLLNSFEEIQLKIELLTNPRVNNFKKFTLILLVKPGNTSRLITP